MKAEELLGMREIPKHPKERLLTPWDCDGFWFDWFLNTWLPEKGHEDMLIFVRGNFDPLFYICWKLAKAGHFDNKPIFRDAIFETVDRKKCEHCQGRKP